MARSIKDVIAEGRLKRFMDPRLIKALAHPMREHALAVFNERTASPTDIGREINLDVPAFYHHVETLEELGFLERVESRRRRGAKEHLFRAKSTALLDDQAWGKIPPSVRADIAASQVWSILDDLVGALRNGAFGASPATHNAWIPGVFDIRGWRECMALMTEALTKMMAIQKRSADRLAANGEPGIPATVAMMGFATSPPGALPRVS